MKLEKPWYLVWALKKHFFFFFEQGNIMLRGIEKIIGGKKCADFWTEKEKKMGDLNCNPCALNIIFILLKAGK